ncbi:hypothetical protein I2486_01950 [Cellulophaga sp. E16_2]|uniref:hypothetical protein n=1 Tax=Cellulophaga sp. E16_2 TaxID=2789297 RepID=UPI001A92D695|nr:hypothetical protein [Cellulophaga sp. E16_2]MBO0590158.1 hypothetical protein [Cellulophaga sp. E16_2]
MLGALKYNKILLLFLLGFQSSIPQKSCEIIHDVSILHPGISLTDKIQKKLIEDNCASDKKVTFYMDVESVVCGDKQCSIDIVRIFWNELGFFQKIELRSGVDLEKAEGKNFTKEDYIKLNEILSDKNAPLKAIYKEDVTKSQTSEGVDALSGATIALDTKSYVKGAVWTCYTLWHWVNSDICNQIRTITAKSKKTAQLYSYIQSDQLSNKIFGLEQIIKRNEYHQKTVDLVVDQLENNNYLLHKFILEYAENTPDSIYYSIAKAALETKNDQLKLLFLISLRTTNKKASIEFYNELGKHLINWQDSYQNTHELFKLFERKNYYSTTIKDNSILLLSSPNFIISRSAYWFLKKQKLSKKEQEKLEAYKNLHKNRL